MKRTKNKTAGYIILEKCVAVCYKKNFIKNVNIVKKKKVKYASIMESVLVLWKKKILKKYIGRDGSIMRSHMTCNSKKNK